jgi:acetyl-CoA carboxylase biotin carboxyl carrier protein
LSKKKVNNKGNKLAAPSGPARPMDVGLLEQIVKLMAANDLNTVDLRDGAQRVVLKRGAAFSAGPVTYAAPATIAPVAASGATPVGAASAPPTAAASADEANLVAIKSPMVGTFYAASSPDAKPFVQVGSTVDEDTDVCIIEAMKVFNNIKAETRGTIAKVLIANGQTVEFGQTLFLVKP